MIREPHFHQFALAELLPFFEQFPTQYLSGERNIKLAYRHLVQPESAVRKLMILVNGRAENMLKWTELAYDFYQQGYDVLLFDHRGQGYSQRIIPQKGHLDEFRFYTDDMAKIIEKTTALYAYQAQYILAHSLGALISTYYLANYDHHIKKEIVIHPRLTKINKKHETFVVKKKKRHRICLDVAFLRIKYTILRISVRYSSSESSSFILWNTF